MRRRDVVQGRKYLAKMGRQVVTILVIRKGWFGVAERHITHTNFFGDKWDELRYGHRFYFQIMEAGA